MYAIFRSEGRFPRERADRLQAIRFQEPTRLLLHDESEMGSDSVLTLPFRYNGGKGSFVEMVCHEVSCRCVST